MTDINDCSYKISRVIDSDVNNDYINPVTDFGGFDLSDDKQGQDDSFPQLVSSNLSSLSKNLQVLAENMKFWSSKLVVREGDVMIDVSLATRECHLLFLKAHNKKCSLIQDFFISLTPAFSVDRILNLT
jgi:hypothetical protein